MLERMGFEKGVKIHVAHGSRAHCRQDCIYHRLRSTRGPLAVMLLLVQFRARANVLDDRGTTNNYLQSSEKVLRQLLLNFRVAG